jgi:hypothetical protein
VEEAVLRQVVDVEQPRLARRHKVVAERLQPQVPRLLDKRPLPVDAVGPEAELLKQPQAVAVERLRRRR